jgi:predicted small integral membrane protein
VDASLQQQLTLAAVGMSAAALFFSLLAAFPGLKSMLAAVRDGVLWFSLFMVIGAGGFLVWQSAQQPGAQLAADSTPQSAD